MARVSNLQSHDKNPSEDIQNVLSYASIVAIPLFFGALAIGNPVLAYAFGEGFSDAGIFLAGLAFWRVLASQNNVLTSVVAGANFPRTNATVSAMSLLLNLVLGVGLFYAIGPVGVVVATIGAEVLRYLWLLWFLRDTYPDVTPISRQIGLQTLSGALMWTLVTQLRSMIGTGSVFHLASLVVVGGSAYAVVLLLLSPHLRDTARGIQSDVGSLIR